MVIFMPYYGQRNRSFQSYSRARLAQALNGQNNSATTTATGTTISPLNGCQIACSILCRFAFSLFLLIIALFLFLLSIGNTTNKKEGSPIIASILLTVAIISFVRTYQKLRQYYIIMDTRRRLIQRLRERQEAYDLTVSLNTTENPELLENVNTDLPSYKELFPSHQNISTNSNDSSTLPPPSYDDYVKNHITHPTTTTTTTTTTASLPQSDALPLSNISSQSQTNSTRCIWITDRTRRPICIRGTMTYV